ncbi:MAG: hypothetical protein ACFFA0_00935 [Promethearchaeota archaeon]
MTPKKRSIKNGFSTGKKRMILPVILLALGLSLMPTGILISFGTQTYSGESTIKKQFSSILLTIKGDLEEDFQSILDDMANDPLNGLYMDKMPLPEEIFFSEWANDWFPDVDIPLIGDQIEAIGAEMIGDIDLDGISPNGDLNISSHKNPSGLTQFQCQAIWDSLNEHSIVSTLPDVWFNAMEGSSEDQEILKYSFNLTTTQLNFLCNWINLSQNTWMKIWAEESIPVINPFLLIGFIGPGLVLTSFGIYRLISQKQKNSKKVTDLSKTSKKEDKK